jgi:hypothetical protein
VREVKVCLSRMQPVTNTAYWREPEVLLAWNDAIKQRCRSGKVKDTRGDIGIIRHIP